MMTNVVICHLVAMSPMATWHLIPMFKNGLQGGDVSAHLGVVHHGHCLKSSSIVAACLIVAMSGMTTWPLLLI